MNAGASRIEALGVSISGNVSAEQIITASDRLEDLNKAFYSRLFAQGGFNLRAALQGHLLEGASGGVINDGVAAAVGVAFHPNNSTSRGPVLVVTLGSNPAISIVQQQGGRLEVFPPSVTLFSNAAIGTSDGLKALHAPGGIRREDLEPMDVERKSKRIGRAVAAVLSDPTHGYLSKYHYLPIGGIYLMGGLSIGLDDSLLQEALVSNLSQEVRKKWQSLTTTAFPYALTFGSYEDQSGVHLNGALQYARQSANITIHQYMGLVTLVGAPCE